MQLLVVIQAPVTIIIHLLILLLHLITTTRPTILKPNPPTNILSARTNLTIIVISSKIASEPKPKEIMFIADEDPCVTRFISN